MSTIEALTLFLVMLPLAAMPSSSVALVVARAVSGGRVSGLLSALGIVVGDLLFVAMALIGMSILAEWLGGLFSVVKYCGGAYLIWLGLSLLKPEPAPRGRCSIRRSSTFAADFLAGSFLTLGDVKAILFYASLFPALVDMEKVGLWEISLIVAITAVTVGSVKVAYVIFAAKIVERLRGKVASAAPRKLGGALMIGCGSALIAKA
jgi:threonine/homoserine/homoserine lactone efflux protein